MTRLGQGVPDPTMAVAVAETRFADAWEAHNRAEIAAIVRADGPAAVAADRAAADVAIRAASDAVAGLALESIGPEDRRAVAAMRTTLGLLIAEDPSLSVAVHAPVGGPDDDRTPEALLADGGPSALRHRMSADFAAAAEALAFDGEVLDRREVLARLGTEEDPATRRRLFLALEPVWRAVDGDSGPASPYRIALRADAANERHDGSAMAEGINSRREPPAWPRRS